MNIPTLMTKVAALSGHPIPTSKRPAPLDADGSHVIPADAAGQVRRTRAVREVRNTVFARHPSAGRNGAPLSLRMDIVMPDAPGAHPLVVFVPGGGFVMSPKAGGRRMRRALAAAGYVVASIEYRTTRHNATYLDGLADVRAAVRFLRANAAGYRIDAAHVALWGESAGGYLVAMAGATNGDPRFDPEGGGRVQAVIDKFGGSDLSRIADGFDPATIDAVDAPGNAVARYVHGPRAVRITDDPAAVDAANPITYVTAASPPFLIFHGSDDRIISPVQTALLHRALRKAGADSTRYLVTGAGHGDLAVKGGEERFWTTEQMLRFMTEFLDRHLDPDDTDAEFRRSIP
ncbi:prolyl oligopeptidase family serine peptidase [Agromyces sp. NPDC056379]|uniref:prolyl oligopeptidase family serine peptidase n=1 Tax=unclassified Agromyces TaxID=2639701 RepID=UPI0035E1AD4B